MFLCPCEIDLRTLISFRICHARAKQNGFPISLVESWHGERTFESRLRLSYRA